MAKLDDLTVTIRFPEVRPEDVEMLRTGADALPIWHEELRGYLRGLADRIASMLLTAQVRETPPEDR